MEQLIHGLLALNINDKDLLSWVSFISSTLVFFIPTIIENYKAFTEAKNVVKYTGNKEVFKIYFSQNILDGLLTYVTLLILYFIYALVFCYFKNPNDLFLVGLDTQKLMISILSVFHLLLSLILINKLNNRTHYNFLHDEKIIEEYKKYCLYGKEEMPFIEQKNELEKTIKEGKKSEKIRI